MPKSKKYIFITGGVISSLGKGITAASIGALLETRGLKVSLQKLDPYLNVDPGTMNPLQHGEVFVTDDGAETDLDLGHYERFTHAKITKASNMTAGKIYFSVIEKERRGDYLGGTVQVIPHVTDEIKKSIVENSKTSDADVAIIEIGGTVGDIESQPFLEAIRQLKSDLGDKNVIYVHLTLVPFMGTADELKTKPTQHSVKELRSIGIQPDIIVCRTPKFLPLDIKKKISLFCSVAHEAVITAKDVECIYEIPIIFNQEGLDNKVVELLNIWTGKPDLEEWTKIVTRIKNPKSEVTIGVVGKYVNLKESYKSLNEALIHGGIANNCKTKIEYIDSEEIEKGDVKKILSNIDGILIPGGFGSRGIEGKISAIKFARENKIPFFGICLGMQLATIEFARNVCGLVSSNSCEFDANCKNKIIDLMETQKNVDKMGGTMRLGAYPCVIDKQSKCFKMYKKESIEERHRHRYEFNNKFRELFSKNGMLFGGLSPDKNLVEIIEYNKHPWFIACQFHPEFKSKPMDPHPLFVNFIKASLES